MSLEMPDYLAEIRIDEQPIHHSWRDDYPESAYGDENVRLENRIALVARRGQAALAGAITEWVVWRFRKHSDDPLPGLYVEAVWAGIIDWRYLNPQPSPESQIKWANWSGNIRGPLCAASGLLKHVAENASKNRPCAYRVVCLSNLVEHIIEEPDRFSRWRKTIINRIIEICPKSKEDPMGHPLPREVCDPGRLIVEGELTQLLKKFLAKLNVEANPYLRTPEALSALGFEGKPYTL